jgi:hypothetical protein
MGVDVLPHQIEREEDDRQLNKKFIGGSLRAHEGGSYISAVIETLFYILPLRVLITE